MMVLLDSWSKSIEAAASDVSVCSSVYHYVSLCGQTVGMLVAEDRSEASDWRIWDVHKTHVTNTFVYVVG